MAGTQSDEVNDGEMEPIHNPQNDLFHDADPSSSHGSFTGFEEALAHRCRQDDPYTVMVTAKAHKTMKGYVTKDVVIERVDIDHEYHSTTGGRWDEAVASRQVRPGSHEDCPLCGRADEFSEKMFHPEMAKEGNRTLELTGERASAAHDAVVTEVFGVAETGIMTEETGYTGGTPYFTVGYHSDLNDIDTSADLRTNWCEGPHQFGSEAFVNKHPFVQLKSFKQAENVTGFEVGERINNQSWANRKVRLEGNIDTRHEPGIRVLFTTTFSDDTTSCFSDPVASE